MAVTTALSSHSLLTAVQSSAATCPPSSLSSAFLVSAKDLCCMSPAVPAGSSSLATSIRSEAMGSGSNGSLSSSRRLLLSSAAAALLSLPLLPAACEARERRPKTNIPEEDYIEAENGLKYYDLSEGKGAPVEDGADVLVHFDVIYKSLTVVSSRESKLLGGNRTISQPYELTVGSKPGSERKKRDFVENANGLYSAQAAPKPPKALYAVTAGMRVGGKRTVIVPAEMAYGDKGYNEIPPGGTIQLNIELLEVKPSL